MKLSTKKIIVVALSADETVGEENRAAVIATLEGRDAPAPLLTSREVQHILKVSKSGLRRMTDRGVLTPVRLGYLVRFRQAEVERLMQDGCE